MFFDGVVPKSNGSLVRVVFPEPVNPSRMINLVVDLNSSMSHCFMPYIARSDSERSLILVGHSRDLAAPFVTARSSSTTNSLPPTLPRKGVESVDRYRTKLSC
jgi:hypothetical protein